MGIGGSDRGPVLAELSKKRSTSNQFLYGTGFSDGAHPPELRRECARSTIWKIAPSTPNWEMYIVVTFCYYEGGS